MKDRKRNSEGRIREDGKKEKTMQCIKEEQKEKMKEKEITKKYISKERKRRQEIEDTKKI